MINQCYKNFLRKSCSISHVHAKDRTHTEITFKFVDCITDYVIKQSQCEFEDYCTVHGNRTTKKQTQ